MCGITNNSKKDSLRALNCHFLTCLLHNLLCMLILQNSQSPSSKARTNNNPLPPKHQILQRQRAHQSQWPRTRILGCRLVDLQKAEEIWKNGHHHSNSFGRCKIMPSKSSSRYCQTNLKLPWFFGWFTSFVCHDQGLCDSCHIAERHWCPPGCCGSNRRAQTQNKERGHRYTLN